MSTVSVFDLLLEDVWALILSYVEEDEAADHSCAGALRCTSTHLKRRLTSHAYYYAANVLLREQSLGRFFRYYRRYSPKCLRTRNT